MRLHFLALIGLWAGSAAASDATLYERGMDMFESATRLRLATAVEAGIFPLRCVSAEAPVDLINASFHGYTDFRDPVVGRFGRLTFNLAEYPARRMITLDLRGNEDLDELTDARGQLVLRRRAEHADAQDPAYIFTYDPQTDEDPARYVCWTF